MANQLTLEKHADIETVLVVGANGNVGTKLIPELLRVGYRVKALQYRSKVPERHGQEIVEGNTLDRVSLAKACEGVDAVCHLIRATGPGDDAFERWLNCAVVGGANLLEAAKNAKVKRYITGSADNVFGHTTIPHYGPLSELAPKRFADGYYGLFKIAEEELCRQYYLGFGLPTTVARFPLIWQDDFAEKGVGCLDKENKTILKRLDVDGKPHVRHDIHVDDVVRALLLVLARDEAAGQDFNFAGPAPYSSTQLCEIFSRKYGWPIEERASDWHSWTLDDTRARSMLGYAPAINLLEWLTATYGL